jgi:hypothetical protein
MEALLASPILTICPTHLSLVDLLTLTVSQVINPGLRPFVMFLNMLFLQCKFISLKRNPQAGGPLLTSYLQLLIQYISS